MESESRLKTVLLGMGAAFLAGALYFLTREVEVEGPGVDPKQKQKPQQGKSPQKAKLQSKPQARPQHRQEAEERPTMTRAATMPVKEERRSTDLVEFDNGVITTDSLLQVLNVMKDKYWKEMAPINETFRRERREALHSDLARYEAVIKQWEKQQGQVFGLVYLSTIQDFGLEENDFAKYGQRHRPELLFSHMKRITIAPLIAVTDETMTAEDVQKILEEHLRLLTDQKARQSYKLMGLLMAEDLLYEGFGLETDQITALGQKYKDVQGVKEVQSQINALLGS